MPRELIRRARNILRGQEFEGESGDLNFDDVTRIDYLPDNRTAMLHSKGAISVDTVKNVYKVVTGDGVALESALAENFAGSDTVVTFDIHPNSGLVNAYFDEAKGEIELYLAE